MDFGLAKRSEIDLALTDIGTLLGTIPYMSPEQTREALNIGASSDQYSLGVVLYRLLTKTLPFQGTAERLIHDICHSPPPKPQSLDRTIPVDLETICLKAMDKEIEGRYPSAGAMADDLFRWLRGEPIKARPIGWPERLTRWARKNPVVASLVTTVGVLLVAIAAGALFSSFRDAHSAGTLSRRLGSRTNVWPAITSKRVRGLWNERMNRIPRTFWLRYLGMPPHSRSMKGIPKPSESIGSGWPVRCAAPDRTSVVPRRCRQQSCAESGWQALAERER